MRFLIFITLILFSNAAIAGQNNGKQPSLPAVLKADTIDGDQNTNVINAIGNVELEKNGNILFSDQLSYDKNSQTIKATGNIKIKNYDTGNVLAKTANVKSDFKSGNFDDATIVFKDGSYIKSPLVTRINESETVFATPTFSICPNDDIKDSNGLAGKKTDTISITSKQTIVDKATDSVKTKHGVIRFYNFPVFYIPYLKTPIPSSKRKSGFLHISYVKTSKLGTGLKIPYYFNIAPDKDLTTTVQTHPTAGHLIVNNHYRQLTTAGLYDVNLELANNKPKNNNLIGTEENQQSLRWRLKANGDFIFPKAAKKSNLLVDSEKSYGLDFRIDNVGDKNYLLDYNNQFDGYTISEVNFDYIKNKDYASIKTVKIQELEVGRDASQAPTAIPILHYYTERKPEHSLFNQTYSLLTNATSITRNNGLQYRRLSLKPEVKIPYNLSGNLFELSGNVQGDFYNTENNFAGNTPSNNAAPTSTVNYRPEANLQWSLPIVTKKNNTTLILEPLVVITASSYTNGNRNIPNEDTNNTELTQNNLFLSDRLTGFDRNEAGQRVTYGFKSSLFNDNIGQLNFGLGQSWRRNSAIQDITIRGFNDNNKSNIVGGLSYRAPKIFNITYNFQLNESSYKNDINEIATGFDFDRIKIGSNYIFIRKTSTNLTAREQIDFSLMVNITKKLVFDTSTTHDLIAGRQIGSKYGITYNGCCISYGISFSENNPTALSSPEKSYNINFLIKNL